VASWFSKAARKLVVLLPEVLLDTYTVEAVAPVSKVTRLAANKQNVSRCLMLTIETLLAVQALNQTAIVSSRPSGQP
jgi:hypothetical protein